MVTEGYLSELYDYKEADKYFYDLIAFEKKAFLLVKGKASKLRFISNGIC
ncbi:hypothetical protein N9811_03115 [Bacteroidia bacterium]|nr:hypothetical protein [Bacteroidia bacterium]